MSYDTYPMHINIYIVGTIESNIERDKDGWYDQYGRPS